MDTIKNYLDSMFAPLPETEETVRAKAELGAMMEDKYNELRSEGVSENEAIGTVIAEFGNIDELADELNIADILNKKNGSNAQSAHESNNAGDTDARHERRSREEKAGKTEPAYVNERAETVISVFWPTVTCVYLILSFLCWGWGSTWIIWPVAAFVFIILKRALRIYD